MATARQIALVARAKPSSSGKVSGDPDTRDQFSARGSSNGLMTEVMASMDAWSTWRTKRFGSSQYSRTAGLRSQVRAVT